jgi:hypothetical protein
VRVWPQFELTQERLEQIAAHITTFSLCSLRAMSEQSMSEQSMSVQSMSVQSMAQQKKATTE